MSCKERWLGARVRDPQQCEFSLRLIYPNAFDFSELLRVADPRSDAKRIRPRFLGISGSDSI
jgi:hypothetical protein